MDNKSRTGIIFMTPEEEYQRYQGTVNGEIRHEVYVKYGKDAYETAKYGWHNANPSIDTQKMYTLVNSNPVQFLCATIIYPLIDLNSQRLPADQSSSLTPFLSPDFGNPTNLHLEWYDANIPFVDKDDADKNELSYTLR